MALEYLTKCVESSLLVLTFAMEIDDKPMDNYTEHSQFMEKLTLGKTHMTGSSYLWFYVLIRLKAL